METTDNQAGVNGNRLFYGSCFALITTAFSFAIAAGILDQRNWIYQPVKLD